MAQARTCIALHRLRSYHDHYRTSLSRTRLDCRSWSGGFMFERCIHVHAHSQAFVIDSWVPLEHQLHGRVHILFEYSHTSPTCVAQWGNVLGAPSLSTYVSRPLNCGHCCYPIWVGSSPTLLPLVSRSEGRHLRCKVLGSNGTRDRQPSGQISMQELRYERRPRHR